MNAAEVALLDKALSMAIAGLSYMGRRDTELEEAYEKVRKAQDEGRPLNADEIMEARDQTDRAFARLKEVTG